MVVSGFPLLFFVASGFPLLFRICCVLGSGFPLLFCIASGFPLLFCIRLRSSTQADAVAPFSPFSRALLLPMSEVGGFVSERFETVGGSDDRAAKDSATCSEPKICGICNFDDSENLVKAIWSTLLALTCSTTNASRDSKRLAASLMPKCLVRCANCLRLTQHP